MMRVNTFTTSFATLAALAFSSPAIATEPCAEIAAILAKANGNLPIYSNTGNYIIKEVDTAYACLKSVPLQKADDLKQLEGLKTLLQFQSTLPYLKNPNPGFLYPGVDVMSSLDAMISKVRNEGYTNEFDVQQDVWNLLASAYDFHFSLRPDMLSIFPWIRDANLISVAADSTSLPNVYDQTDLPALAGTNSSGYKPSPIVKINDMDVEQWVNQYATFNPWDHDPDANYNRVFTNVPQLDTTQGFGPGTFASFIWHYPGTETVLTFANGTSKHVPSYATVAPNLDFTGVKDGQSLFDKFCGRGVSPPGSSSGAVPSASASASLIPSGIASASASASGSASFSSVTTNNLYTALATVPAFTAPTAYPTPELEAPDGSIRGFFPKGESDLAVITLPTFGPAAPTTNYLFQNIFRSMLATAKKLGKTRLILDIRGNNGGNVVDGYSLFRQLFPSMSIYGASNLAAWPLVNGMGLVGSSLDGNKLEKSSILAEFSVFEDLTVHDTDYASWSDFYGPVQHHGGEFTNIRRYNFSSPFNEVGLPMYGFQNDTHPQPQTFQPENIVMLSDGFCGSTCAIFSELLKTQGGVKAITVGGRKQFCPSQPVGGSKGSNDQDLTTLAQSVQGALKLAKTPQEKNIFESYIKAGLLETAAAALNREAYWNPFGNSVNFQNNLRKGDDSATPLQFVYEASSCRFFYTPQMIADQSLVWSQVYNLQWGNAACLKGSTGQPSAATGFETSYLESPPPTCAKNFFGASLGWSYPGAVSAGSPSPSGTSRPSGTGSSGTAPTYKPPQATGAGSALRTSALEMVYALALAVAGASLFL